MESSYNCSHLFAVVSMPYNKTYRPFYGVRAQLWAYSLASPIASPKLIEKVNTVSGTIMIISNFCKNDSGKESALALELTTYGPYGESEPWVVTPRRISSNATRDSFETLYFPTTDVLLTAKVSDFRDCFQEGRRKFNSEEVDFAYSYFMISYVMGPIVDELEKQNVPIDFRNSYSTKTAFVLRINFANIPLSTAVGIFQKFLEGTKRLGHIQAGWCQIGIEYKCILNQCNEFENPSTMPITHSARSYMVNQLATTTTSSARYRNGEKILEAKNYHDNLAITSTQGAMANNYLTSTLSGSATAVQTNLFWGFFLILLVTY